MATPDEASYCLLQAAECERKAQTATSPEIKAAFLEMKRRWLPLKQRPNGWWHRCGVVAELAGRKTSWSKPR